MSEYSHFHERLCCSECDWFEHPDDISIRVQYGWPEPTVCPDCGGAISEAVGRLHYTDVPVKRFWGATIKTVCDGFERRAA